MQRIAYGQAVAARNLLRSSSERDPALRNIPGFLVLQDYIQRVGTEIAQLEYDEQTYYLFCGSIHQRLNTFLHLTGDGPLNIHQRLRNREAPLQPMLELWSALESLDGYTCCGCTFHLGTRPPNGAEISANLAVLPRGFLVRSNQGLPRVDYRLAAPVPRPLPASRPASTHAPAPRLLPTSACSSRLTPAQEPAPGQRLAPVASPPLRRRNNLLHDQTTVQTNPTVSCSASCKKICYPICARYYGLKGSSCYRTLQDWILSLKVGPSLNSLFDP